MSSEEKNYEQSALGKRVNELMDDGYDFGEAVKQAMSEGLKDGGSVGIEILFGPKRDNFRYGGDTMGGRNDRSRSSPGPDRSRVSAQQESNHGRAMAAAQSSGGGISYIPPKDKENFLDKIKNTTDKIVDNPLTKLLDPRSKIALAMGGYKFLRDGIPNYQDDAINQELEKIPTMGGISPYADGGRVGFFMGGPALEGPSLSIYDSMKAYGATDQAISDAIKRAGYELPTADSGTTPETTPSVIDNLGITDPQPYSKVDQLSYRDLTVGDGSNFGPGKKLEINPAALGMSFYDAEPAKKEREGFIGKTIDAFTSTPPRQLSQFTTPTGVSNLRGPAELGFMTTDIEGLPGLNRDMIRSQYDNYSQFFGRPSNFPDAKVPGKASQLANMVPYVGTAKRGLEAMFGPAGDKSLQSKYTVDGAGFGNTGARDEFGLATFDRKDGFLGLTGDTTRDYTDRMSQRLDELGNFFSSKGIDINDPDAYNKMKDINSTYAKQVLAYQQRTAVENLNKKQKDAVERQKQKAIEEAAKKQREAAATIAAAEKAARERELARRQTIVDAQKATTGFTTSGGAGNYRSDRDNSRDGGYGGSSQRSRDNRSSDLGFSDIRLKENVELIGKSPSNINIYKFNYKDSPTTYQGAMAHEVPWASVKHSNGYMMIDYNKIDVEFKLYDVH